MPKIKVIAIFAALTVSAHAAGADNEASISVPPSIDVVSASSFFQVTVARGAGSSKLIINRSDQIIEVFDTNMARIDLIKPGQSLDVSETLQNINLVAFSIGGSELTYVSSLPGTVATVETNQEETK